MKQVAAALLLGLFMVVVLVDVRPAWALTITPNPPIAGQSFTITSSTPTPPAYIYVYAGPGCMSSPLWGASSPTTLTLSAGQYSTNAHTGYDPCVNFTVIAQPIPEYPYELPVLAVFMVIAYGLIRRKTVTSR